MQLDLLCADLWSYWRHVSSETWTWPSLILTQGLLAAAATHVYYGHGIVRSIARRGRQERELAGLGALVMLGVGLWILPWQNRCFVCPSARVHLASIGVEAGTG